MAGIDLTTAETKLQELLDAHTAVCSGQSVAVDGRSLTRANLADIESGIAFWDRQCKRLDARSTGRRRIASLGSTRG